ncbi:MAG: helix-turn-helix domain-containing protein [Kineosporiaceae bacterium]
MDVAPMIRTAREKAGLSQAALAVRAGTSQPAVSRYESGVSSPSVATLERLLAAAGHRLILGAEPGGCGLDVRVGRLAKLRANRAAVRDIAYRHGASNVRVFGSVVRGEDGPDSDVDLLVDLDVHAVGLVPLAEIADEVSALLNERVDVAPASALQPHVAASARAEAVPL